MSLESRRNRARPKEDHWVPLSDLMTGLMMIFLLVAIVFMLQVKRNEEKIVEAQNKVREIATRYTDLRGQLYQELSTEFKDDLPRWRASIKPDLTVRFEEPTVQFDTGNATVKDSFKTILNSFFPRYIRILRSPKYADAIEEEVLPELEAAALLASSDPDASEQSPPERAFTVRVEV